MAIFWLQPFEYSVGDKIRPRDGRMIVDAGNRVVKNCNIIFGRELRHVVLVRLGRRVAEHRASGSSRPLQQTDKRFAERSTLLFEERQYACKEHLDPLYDSKDPSDTDDSNPSDGNDIPVYTVCIRKTFLRSARDFQEVFAELNEVIENATFISIDGEFTGLNSGPDAGAFDTPAQYYAKLRSGSMDFLLVQFGLSIFTFNTETQKYSQRSYNIYIFPRPLNRSATDCRFMCQTSCISFLTSQGFDFNKLFKFGIPYLTASEEEKLVKRLEEKQKIREDIAGGELLPISDIDEFITSEEEEELVIDKCNAFIRRLVYQEAKLRWPNKLRIESKLENFACSLVIQRSGTKEEEEQRDVEKREKERIEIQQAVGLSMLMRKISNSGKLIVGHNMLLDLCHIVHQFFGHLPESYLEFKSLVHSLFPRILDTKIICHSQQFKENVPSSNLSILLETVSKSPFKITEVESVEGRSYSILADKCHEAGYDAYITGICFIALSNYLGGVQISWLNDTSAYIGLHRRDQVNIVMKALGKTNTYNIQKYADYQASLGVAIRSGDRKRKLSSS
ncbi:unnamed protein product, partial [Heterotrigona itama]